MKGGRPAATTHDVVTPRVSRFTDFITLTKPRLNSLVVVTTGVGYLATGTPVDVATLANTTIGAALVAGAAAVLNQIAERDLDERMERTRDRPLAAGRLQPAEAAWFAAVLGLVGLLQIAIGANSTAAVLALATLVSYTGVYTPLKRHTHWAVLVGAVPGGLPVLIGWAAAPPVSAAAWSLFALVFMWQLPQFIALTRLYSDDFAKAKLPLLAVTDPTGQRAARHLLVYSVLLIPVSLTPAWLGVASTDHAVGTGIVGLALLGVAIWFASHRSADRARVLFRATLTYLPIVWILLLTT
ncbi:MAG: heme o synthase [Acidobacteriota bacterium]|nr:heme o synthase [Acidobacteriota bacterium]